MKFIPTIGAGLASLGLLVAASAQDPVKFNVPGAPASTPAAAPAAAPATKPGAPVIPPAPSYTDAQVFEAYGWLMGMRMGLSELEFTTAQVEAMARGMSLVAQGKQLSFDTQQIGPSIDAALQKKNAAFMNKLKQQGLAETAAFLAKLKENKNVKELPSGLRYEVVQAGTGAKPKVGQTATVHYTGAFVNGEAFDSSVQRGEPADLIVQEPSQADPRGVIPGMVEGLQQVGVGGKIKLYVPPHLAYGDDGVPGGIPPASTLVFDVEVLGVKDSAKFVPPPAPPAGAK